MADEVAIAGQNIQSASPLSRLLTWWVDSVCSKTSWILVIALLLSAGAFEYTRHHLGFNTNTNNMLAADLPFRQAYQRFEQGFPQYVNNILVVIDTDTPERARDAARQLAQQLENRHELFSSVYLPRANAFMEGHALLYQDMPKLEKTASDLTIMQPFLGRLASDSSLRGLFRLLKDVVEAEDGSNLVDITPVLNPVTTAIQAIMNDRHAPLSWQELMQGSGKKANHSSKGESGQYQQFILLQPKMDFSSMLAAGSAIKAVRTAAESLYLDAGHGVRVRLTGSAALSHDELVSVSTGAGGAALLSLLLVTVLLTAGLGSFRFVVATLLCLSSGLLLTAAFAALTIGHLNLISVAFAVLYIGLGVDYAIHLCLRCREVERTGQTTPAALWHATNDVGGSLVICAITTAIGFYCFVPTDYTGVSELGLISGSGMFISLVVTLTLLPAILCVWDKAFPLRHRQTTAPARHLPAMLDSIIKRLFANFLSDGCVIRILTVITVLGAAIWLPQARFDYNPINLRDQSSESVTTYKDLVAGRTISPSSIMVLSSDVQQVHDFQRRLAKLDAVDKTISLFDFIPAHQEEKLALIDDMALMLGLEPDAAGQEKPSLAQQLASIRQLESALNSYIMENSQPLLNTASMEKLTAFRQLHQALQSLARRLSSQPADTQAATVEALQYDLLGTLPSTLDLLQTALDATAISRQDLPATLSQRWLSSTGSYRIEVIPKGDIGDIESLRRFVAEVRKIAPDATGGPVFTLAAGDAVIGAFVQAFSIALALIFLVLLLLLRQLTDTLLILLPLLLAAMLINAGAALLNIPFNFANVIALPLLLGIGVDNGIHMVQRFRHMQANQPHHRHRLLQSSTSRAVMLSALTTICSFGALSFSPHQGTADMGQLLTLGVVIILVCTLIVLPAFLQWHPIQKVPKTGASS